MTEPKHYHLVGETGQLEAPMPVDIHQQQRALDAWTMTAKMEQTLETGFRLEHSDARRAELAAKNAAYGADGVPLTSMKHAHADDIDMPESDMIDMPENYHGA